MKYTITVTNTGNTTLQLTLEDVFTVDGEAKALELSGAKDPASFELKEGEETVFTAEYKIEDVDTELVNAVTVSDGEDEKPAQVETTVENNPKWKVTKAITNKGSGENGAFVPEDVVKYSITVENIGNVKLEGLKLEDTLTVDGESVELELKHASESAANFDLEKHESIIFTAEYKVKATDNNLLNAAVVTLGDHSETGEVEIPVKATPDWTVTKTTDKESY